MSMWNTTMGAATAEFAYNDKGWRVGYVVTDTFIDYTKSLSRYFIQHFEKLGGQILFEDTYVQGAQDFSAQLARLKASAKKPEFIFISSYMPDLATIIRTIREAGIRVPIVGGDSYDDPGLFKALGEEYGSDIYYDTHSFLAEGVSPKVDEFLAAFQAKYNAKPDAVWVAPGWDVVHAPGRRHAEGGDHRRRRRGQGHGRDGVRPGHRQAELVRRGHRPRARQAGADDPAGQGRAQVPGLGASDRHSRSLTG